MTQPTTEALVNAGDSGGSIIAVSRPTFSKRKRGRPRRNNDSDNVDSGGDDTEQIQDLSSAARAGTESTERASTSSASTLSASSSAAATTEGPSNKKKRAARVVGSEAPLGKWSPSEVPLDAPPEVPSAPSVSQVADGAQVPSGGAVPPEALVAKEEARDEDGESSNEDFLECPTCLNSPRRKPVFFCSNGHLIVSGHDMYSTYIVPKSKRCLAKTKPVPA